MNNDFLITIGLASLPGLGNFGGGLLSEWLRPTAKTLNLALHAAAGIILAVIAVEVMPEALSKAPAWLLALSFLLGGGAYIIVGSRIDRWQEKKKAELVRVPGWSMLLWRLTLLVTVCSSARGPLHR